MPTATSEALSAHEAIDIVADHLDVFEDVGAKPLDLNFLKAILTDETLFRVVDIHEDLEVQLPPARDKDSVTAARNILEELNEAPETNEDAMELRDILEDPHFRALLVAYDDVSKKNYEGEIEQTSQLLSPPPPIFNDSQEPGRCVNIRKSETAPLGMTVKLDEMDDLVIARVLEGSVIDKQGILHVGDIIREVNGFPVATPEQLMDMIIQSDPDIRLMIIPSFQRHTKTQAVFMKAHFNYDPMKDRLLPCKEMGLPFNDGDVLEILSTDDTNYWQARYTDEPGRPVGLIPSEALEEKRKSFVNPELDYSKSSLFCGLSKKKKKTVKYSTKDSKEYDKADVLIYEEVKRTLPFTRPFLVLVGAKGVGRRSLKERLIKDDPLRFGTPIAHTSRAPRAKEKDGEGYYFTDRESMEHDILDNKYIEHGEYNFNLYGTRVDTAWDVVKNGKMCILDVSPTALKMLRSREYTPYIAFIAAPSVEALKVMYEEGRQKMKGGRRGANVIEIKSEQDMIQTVKESAQIEKQFGAFFDEVIVNDNFEDTYLALRRSLNDITSREQWVPVNWMH